MYSRFGCAFVLAMALITYTKTGGFAGVENVLVIDEKGNATFTSDMSGTRKFEGTVNNLSASTNIHELINQLDFSSMQNQSASNVYDDFVYSIAVTDEGRSKNITFSETNIPPSINSVKAELDQLIKEILSTSK
jgi:hypothetical protein